MLQTVDDIRLPPPGIMLQFLAWVNARPRNYAEAMEAWRTSCPRLSVWEDATADGLVQLEPCRGTQGQSAVVLTARGAGLLSPSP